MKSVNLADLSPQNAKIQPPKITIIINGRENMNPCNGNCQKMSSGNQAENECCQLSRPSGSSPTKSLQIFISRTAQPPQISRNRNLTKRIVQNGKKKCKLGLGMEIEHFFNMEGILLLLFLFRICPCKYSKIPKITQEK